MGGQVMAYPPQKTASLFIASLFYILLFSLFLFPSISIVDGWPKVQIAEMLLPFLLIYILTYKAFVDEIKVMSSLLAIISVYALIIFLSIIINSRTGMLRDYFEILKLIKFSILMIFAFLFIEKINFTKTIKWIFALVLLFNFIHYVNFLDFNKHIQVYYGNELHVLGFGLNSLGESATKRILGTVGNPNNNAILFLFFTIFFFPEKQSGLKDKIFFYLAVLGVLACQSRTGFIAFGIVYLIAIFLLKHDFKNIAVDLAVFVFLYLFLFFMGNMYLSSLAGNMMKQNSVRSRLETWKMLFEMIKQKPIVGWSPYKEYIDSNKIYPEGEYIFVAWKYGALGLIAHLSWIGRTTFISWKKRSNRSAINLFLFTIVLLITSITNTPLYDQVILSIFAVMVGSFFNSMSKISGL